MASIFEVEKGGRVVLKRSLDFESCQNYILPISVTDGDFSAETTLHVIVADVNDEAPRFEINPIHLVAEEGTSAKRSIGQVLPTVLLILPSFQCYLVSYWGCPWWKNIV